MRTVRTARSHKDAVGTFHRSAFKLLTSANTKTPKGESLGFLTATLYLMPHDSGGGKTLCPHSTPACREMCLSGAGLSGLPKQLRAKQNRTDFWNGDPNGFIDVLSRDFDKLVEIAERERLRPAVRLNGTSDIVWERLMRMRPDIQFYDYTKIPLHLRKQSVNYHLTYSVGDSGDIPRAIDYLRAGQSVAVVTTEIVKHGLVDIEVNIGPCTAHFTDGDENDLRFLDRPSSIVLLKPKGHRISELVRPDILNEIVLASRSRERASA